MKRLVVVAAGAIALLGVAAFAAIALMTGRPAPSAGSSGSPAVESRDAPAPPPAAPATPAFANENTLGRPPAVPMAPPRLPPVAPPPPAPGSWEAVDPVGRPADLGPIGHSVLAGLRDASDKLAACFDSATEAQYASTGARPVSMIDTTAGAIGGPPVLMLELEMQPGSVYVVDAPVEWQGTAGDGVILCAQHVLRGMRMAAPGATAGGRHRMRYALMR